MSERDTAEPETTEPKTSRPETSGPEAAEPDTSEPETSEQPDGVGFADSVPALLLLVPASVLLRYLGEHGWAYWTAAVLGVLGLPAVGLGIAAAVGSLRRGRRRLFAGYTIALLLTTCFLLVVRLIEN